MAARKGGSSGGGIKGFIASAAILITVFGGLFGLAKVNNIQTIDDVFSYMDSLREEAYDCGIEQAEWNCRPGDKDPGSLPKPNPDGGDTGTGSFNPTDENIDEATTNQSTAALEALKVSEPVKSDYNRSDWKHWVGSPCNARIQTLQRDGTDVVVEDCKAVSGNWADPYSDLTFTNSSDLDIDHIIPLAYANRHGGANWSAEKKQEFANDPINLIASSAKENRKKSDDGPGDYMPPKKSFQCSYSNSWIQIAAKYDLSITEKDKKALQTGLKRC